MELPTLKNHLKNAIHGNQALQCLEECVFQIFERMSMKPMLLSMGVLRSNHYTSLYKPTGEERKNIQVLAIMEKLKKGNLWQEKKETIG